MQKTILVVDDEYTMRELIDLSLEGDYRIVKAEDGFKALELAKNKPDLVILDIMMPKMDGFEVCRKLKSAPDTKDIPIMILTAKHTMEDLQQAILCDVDEYMTKPFEPETLKKRVDFYLSAKNTKIQRKLLNMSGAIHYIKERG